MSIIKKPRLAILKESVLEILKKQRCSLNNKQIAWALNLRGGQYRKKIIRAISELEKEKLIIETGKYKFQYNDKEKPVIGTIDINKSGHGYVKSELYKDDIFVDKKNRLNSLNGDTVSMQIIKSHKRSLVGKIKEVVKRANKKFIGIIKTEGAHNFFIPQNGKTGSDFFITNEKLKSAKNNDRVIIQFLDWPSSAGCPFGEVIRVLGENFDLKTHIESSIEIFNLRNLFSKKINRELIGITPEIENKELKTRRDFRNNITFTIDPVDAKDFDDALSIKFLSNKNIEIGIHIADVGHYVRPNSEINKEAFLRAFSIYFPGKVIPMLPEKLSNLICSLRPNEDKLAFSVVVEFNSNLSKLKSVWMGKSVIRSNRRFTYQEVESIILKKNNPFLKEIKTLNTIAQNLRIKRMKSGSIDFQRTDILFELNKMNEPIQVVTTPPLEAHQLVEEFMLLANKLVANKLKKCVYRVHDLPNADLLKEVAKYLKRFKLKKFNFNIKSKKLPLTINNLLKTPDLEVNKNIFQNLILRAMAKASYSTQNIGHYGLGFDEYTHFTSPIRRYADLITHRLLEFSINNSKSTNNLNLEKDCVYLSSMERIYIDIERKTNKFIQLKLLENSIGEAFRGMITSVAKWGIYVEIEGGRGEGLIVVGNLKGDNYYYNDDEKSFIGRKNGKKHQLGDKVLVEIKDVNLFKIEMDLIII